MKQNRCSFHVAEEAHPHPQTPVRSFDQPRDVGDDERFVLSVPNHAEMRYERREWVVGDLRPGGGNAGDEG